MQQLNDYDNIVSRKQPHKKNFHVWFHLHEVLEQIKSRVVGTWEGDRKGLDWGGARENFWVYAVFCILLEMCVYMSICIYSKL